MEESNWRNFFSLVPESIILWLEAWKDFPEDKGGHSHRLTRKHNQLTKYQATDKVGACHARSLKAPTFRFFYKMKIESVETEKALIKWSNGQRKVYSNNLIMHEKDTSVFLMAMEYITVVSLSSEDIAWKNCNAVDRWQRVYF